MRAPGPILTAHLFPELHDGLLALLDSLSADDWARPATPRWTVKDVALHLLGGDVGLLSRKRDGHAFSGSPIQGWDDLVALIDGLNDAWLNATRRMSPRVLCDLLRTTGPQASAYFAALDPAALGDPVDWAGPEPAPVWLDVARELTERWHHQQQIRDAVGRPGFAEPRFLAPTLDAFVRALPRALRDVPAADGTLVGLTIDGPAGARWLVRCETGRWTLHVAEGEAAVAELTLPEDDAWRLFTKGVSPDAARARGRIVGDAQLAEALLRTVAIIG